MSELLYPMVEPRLHIIKKFPLQNQPYYEALQIVAQRRPYVSSEEEYDEESRKVPEIDFTKNKIEELTSIYGEISLFPKGSLCIVDKIVLTLDFIDPKIVDRTSS